MRTFRLLTAAGAFAVIAATVVGQQPAPPKAATVANLKVAFPDRDTASVTLFATPLSPIKSATFTDHRLTVGTISVPMRGKAVVKGGAAEVEVTFPVKLADLPAETLDLPFDAVTVRWYGLDRSGRPAVVVSGILDVRDRAMVRVEEADMRRHFARLGPVEVSPGLDTVGVRVLLNVYNPLRFDLVATKLSYALTVGERELLATERPGFRLRAGQGSDVMLEDSMPLTDAVGAAMGLIRQQPTSLAGTLTLRTPSGERAFPMFLAGGQ